jgi:hypothetical protein
LPARGGNAGSPDDGNWWRTGRETEQPPLADQPLPARKERARVAERVVDGAGTAAAATQDLEWGIF